MWKMKNKAQQSENNWILSYFLLCSFGKVQILLLGLNSGNLLSHQLVKTLVVHYCSTD